MWLPYMVLQSRSEVLQMCELYFHVLAFPFRFRHRFNYVVSCCLFSESLHNFASLQVISSLLQLHLNSELCLGTQAVIFSHF